MITCLERIVDTADLLFDKERLSYRTPESFVLQLSNRSEGRLKKL